MAKIFYIICLLFLLSYCVKPTEYATLEEESIIIYNKNLINRNITVQDSSFQFLCNDSSNLYFSNLTNKGKFSTIIDLNQYFKTGYNYDSVESTTINRLKTLDNGNLFFFKYLNDSLTQVIKFNSQNQLEWKSSYFSPDLGSENQKNILYSNGNYAVVDVKREFGEEKFNIFERIYNINTGNYVDSVSYSFENEQLIDIFNLQNSGYVIFTGIHQGVPPNFSYNNIKISKINDGNLTHFETNLSAIGVLTFINIDEDHVLMSFAENNDIYKAIYFSFLDGLIWQKEIPGDIDNVSESDGSFYITGYSYIEKTLYYSKNNKTGIEVWTNILDVQNSEGINLIVDENQTISIIGVVYNDITQNNTIFLIKTDSLGIINY